MATAGVNRMMLWTDLEGRELLGRWRLGALVRPEGRTAWFAATSEGRALVLSVTETLNDDEELLERLRAVAQLRHPNLVAVEEACAAYIDETPVVIAVMEPTEENLGDVLRERSLQMPEAQQVLRALVQGLAALHAAGLVHGRMEPASVLAMGETIKLRSDCVQLGGEDFAVRSAEDVRGLGRVVTRSVTGRVPAGENDPMLQLLPEPMARAVRRSLSGNARITEIAALAGVVIVPAGRAAEKPAVRRGPVPVAAPVAAPSSAAASNAAESPMQGAVPEAASQEGTDTGVAPPAKPAAKVIALLPASSQTAPLQRPHFSELVRAPEQSPPEEKPRESPPLERQPLGSQRIPNAARHEVFEALDDDEPATQRRSALLVIAIAALLVVATLWALYGMLHSGGTASATKTAAVPASATRPSPNPEKAVSAASSVAQGSGAATVALTTPGWRVIAYTYRKEAQAQHKAEVLRQQVPQLSPGVFALHGREPYLVTLGGVMSKADAFALRNQAVRLGMPRDTYAQNYR